MDCNGLTHTLVDDGSVAADGVWTVPQTGYQPQSNGDQERVMSVDEFVKIAPFHQQAEDVGSYLRQVQTRRDSAKRPFELRPCPSENAD